VIAGATAAPMMHGTPPGGIFTQDGVAPAGNDVVMVDIDDDGDLDALIATPMGVQWLVR
jgi:hypothetical protein